MTFRLYLRSAKVLDEPGRPGDIPVERFFINASEVPEVWVDTAATTAPEVGKAATFVLSRNLNLGFLRISGTVERKIRR